MARFSGWLPVLAVWLLLLHSCCGAMWPFLEPSLSFPERVEDLVSRLTIEEVMEQVGRGGNGFYGSPAPPVERLLIGPYSWNTECLHGDMNNNGTGYPQAIGLAASFSPELVFAVAQAIGEEVRGLYNNFQSSHQYGDHKGLSCFSPVINIMRDPRWGRNQETYGEDPILSGNLATQFVYGLQGNHPRYVRASAGCKHFDVHGGPENIPVDRHTFNANVTERDWRETFLPAFRKCVTAGSYSLMCSFNEINGVPACGNKQLLTDILRGEWDFTGYVVTDGSALTRMMTQHHYVNSTLEAAVLAAKAGVNLENSNNESYPVYFHLIDAIKAGMLTEEAVRNMAKPLFYTRMRLGEFDPPEMNPYSNLTLQDVRSTKHRQLAIRAAMESFVLLKNDKRALPLKRLYDSMAIVGPMSDDKVQIYGDYAVNQPRNTSTPLVGLSPMATHVNHESGCFDTSCVYYYPPDIQKAVTDVDVVIVCLGTGQALESENNDRKDLSLPGMQLQLLQDVVKYANGTPVVLLVFSGGPLDISWALDSDGVQAIMQCHFPGETTGDALLRVLTMTGAASPPAGRLPYTWQRSLDQVPPMVDYSMAGRTYRYWNGPGDPLFPFGYGLSYTTFNHSRLSCFWSNYDPYSDPANLDCFWDLAAMDNIVADEVWQLYVSWESPVAPYLPKLKLINFGRTRVNGTQRSFISTNVYKEDLVVWIDNQGWTLPSGTLKVYAGGEQPGQSRTTGSIMASTTVTISNTFLYDPKKRGASAWRKLDNNERVKGH